MTASFSDLVSHAHLLPNLSSIPQCPENYLPTVLTYLDSPEASAKAIVHQSPVNLQFNYLPTPRAQPLSPVAVPGDSSIKITNNHTRPIWRLRGVLPIRKRRAQVRMHQQTWLIRVERVILHPPIVRIPIHTNIRHIDIGFWNARLRFPGIRLDAC